MLPEEQQTIAAVVATGFWRVSQKLPVHRGALQRLARVTAEEPDLVPASEGLWEWVHLLKQDFPR